MITYQQFLTFLEYEDTNVPPELVSYVKNGPALTIKQIYYGIPRATWYHRLYYAIDGGNNLSWIRCFELSWEEANLVLLHSLALAMEAIVRNGDTSSYAGMVISATADHLDAIRIPWEEVEKELSYVIEDNDEQSIDKN